MGYRQEFSNININVLCADTYSRLSSAGNVVSTDFYIVGDAGCSKKVYLGVEPVNGYSLSSETWTFTLSSGQEYKRNVVFSI